VDGNEGAPKDARQFARNAAKPFGRRLGHTASRPRRLTPSIATDAGSGTAAGSSVIDLAVAALEIGGQDLVTARVKRATIRT
jgi:hypothetical protein